VPRWKLTVRHASEVTHQEFDDLDSAIAVMQTKAEEIRGEGPLAPSSALREFSPADQVHARLQISGNGLLHRLNAGVDVKGDGSLLAFRGTLKREELAPSEAKSPFEAVRETLSDRPQ
jgi:hypothetical protein